MPFYVYILKSENDGTFYKGFTENYLKRLEEHNAGLSTFTSTKRPWKLVCILIFETRREALIKVRKLKKYSHASIEALINSSQNILK
jgi:putative endonuclease